jgi:anti-sigma factor RsiW
MRRRHDPEKDAAAYLAGLGRPRARQRFEEHLLECEECWREVRSARLGRALAEHAREVAPASLRDSVRGAVGLAGAGVRRRRVAVLASAAAVIVLGVAAGWLALTGEGQPEAISAAVAAFRTNQVPAGSPILHDPPDLAAAGLQLEASGHAVMAGLAVDEFSYRSESGQRVMLMLAEEPFPVARGATGHSGTMHRWQAQAEDVSMICADRPMSYLLLGGDPELLRRAEGALGVAGLATG